MATCLTKIFVVFRFDKLLMYWDFLKNSKIKTGVSFCQERARFLEMHRSRSIKKNNIKLIESLFKNKILFKLCTNLTRTSIGLYYGNAIPNPRYTNLGRKTYYTSLKQIQYFINKLFYLKPLAM